MVSEITVEPMRNQEPETCDASSEASDIAESMERTIESLEPDLCSDRVEFCIDRVGSCVGVKGILDRSKTVKGDMTRWRNEGLGFTETEDRQTKSTV